MVYFTIPELSKEWDISARRINTLCNSGRITGAIKVGGRWLIPASSAKPEDRRSNSASASDKVQITEDLTDRTYEHELLIERHRGDSRTEELTVRTLLQSKEFEGLKCVGGRNGLDRKILCVDMMEDPDIAKWIENGAFIVTTGYCIRDDINIQRQIVSDLAAGNCSGIGIKIRRYFHTIPQHMIELADQYDLPLIEIPEQYSVSDIMNESMKRIFAGRLARTEFSYDIQSQMVRMIFHKDGLKEIARLISRETSAYCSIYDSKGYYLAGHSVGDSLRDEDLLILVNDPVKALAAPDAPSMITSEIGGGRASVFSIKNDGYPYGFFILFTEDRTETPENNIVIKDALPILGMILSSTQSEADQKLSMKERFFQSLIRKEGALYSAQALRERVREFDIDIDDKYVCLTVELSTNPDEVHIATKIFPLLKDYFAPLGGVAIPYALGESVSFFLPSKAVKGTWWRLENRKLFLDDLSNKLQSESRDYIIGVSIPVELLKIYTAYDQTLRAISLEKKRIQSDRVNLSCFANVDLETTLITLSREQQEMLRNEYSAKLEAYDQKYNTHLFQTLKEYYICNRNISKAAQVLYVSRNTLIFRLNKIEQILGVDLSDSFVGVKLQMAIHLAPYRI